MAYYYFDSDDHIATVHDADVYLLANVVNYHDFNGEKDQQFAGFYLAASNGIAGSTPTFTVGGNYLKLDENGVIINPHSPYNYNIYQKTEQKANDTTKGNKKYAAVGFAGNGDFVIASQIGAPDAVKHDDRNIYINAYNFLTANAAVGKGKPSIYSSYKDGEVWVHEKDKTGLQYTNAANELTIRTGQNIGYNEKFNTSGQIADVSGIYAAKTLTVKTNYNGTIEVNSRLESIGMCRITPSSETHMETAIDTHTESTGLRGETDVVFDGNFYGNINSTVQVRLQSFTLDGSGARKVTGNTAASYGVHAGENLINNNVWSGGIYTAANRNYLDATISLSANTYSTANGVLNNNLVESVGIRAKNITLNRLDWTENNTHAATVPLEFAVENAKFAWDKNNIQITTLSNETVTVNENVAIEIETVAPEYYIFIPELLHSDMSPYGEGETVRFEYETEEQTFTGSGITKLFDEGLAVKVNFEFYNKFINTSQEDRDKWTFEGKTGASGSKIYYNETCTISWKAGDFSTDGCFILVFGGQNSAVEDYTIFRIEKDEASYNNGTWSYKFTGEDESNHPDIDLRTLSNTSLAGLFAYDYSGKTQVNLINETSNPGFSYISQSNSGCEYDLEFNLTSDSVSQNGSVDDTDGKMATEFITIAGNGTTTPALYFRQYSANGFGGNATPGENKHFVLIGTVSKETIIKSEIINNIFKANDDDSVRTSESMKNNNLNVAGIKADETLTINHFVEGTVIDIDAKDNSIQWLGGGVEGTWQNNIITAYGIHGQTVNLQEFHGTINITANDNIVYVGDGEGYMYVAGIRADGTLNVDRDLYGIIDITATENSISWTTVHTKRNDYFGVTNDCYSSTHQTAGIFAQDINIDGYIKSDINIKADSNITGLVTGIRAEGGTLAAKGFSGNIVIDGRYDGAMEIFGIYATTFKSEIGYYYTFENNATQTAKVVAALDSFNVEGNIAVFGLADDIQAIATQNQANLYLNGTIYAGINAIDTNKDRDDLINDFKNSSYLNMWKCYSVKTDFTHEVSGGFNNDIVQLGDKALVYGIMHLGGGTNTVIFDDDARYFGSVYHDSGKTAITYKLNGEQADNGVVHTVFYDCDATLSSSTTINIDCNNIEIGQEYKLIQYQYEFGGLADTHWKNGSVTVSYMGESFLVHLQNNVGIAQLNITEGEKTFDLNIVVSYNAADNILSVTGSTDDPANVAKKNTLTTVSITPVPKLDENGNQVYMTDAEGNEILDNSGNPIPLYEELEKATCVNAALPEEDLKVIQAIFDAYLINSNQTDLVTYTTDTNSKNSSFDTNAFWICSKTAYPKSGYEIVFDFKDGTNVITSSLVRLNTIDMNQDSFEGEIEISGQKTKIQGTINLVNSMGQTLEQSGMSDAEFNGSHYIFSFDINNIPAGYTVDYKVRDYIHNGTQVNEWNSASIQTIIPTVDLSNVANVDAETMTPRNPDNDSNVINSSIVLLDWEAVDSAYPIDYYTVQYFTSTEDLCKNDLKRQAIFEAYRLANGTSQTELEVTVLDNEGTEYYFNFNVIFDNGEIMIRDIDNMVEIDGTEYPLNTYRFSSKETSNTELLVTGTANQSYIYWQVQATDIKGAKNDFVEGNNIRIYVGDTLGPVFTSTASPNYDRENITPNAAGDKFTISGFTWGSDAVDDKSGIHNYIIEYANDGGGWTELLKVHADDYSPENTYSFELGLGIFNVRVRPVDAAGNYGAPSKTVTIITNGDAPPVDPDDPDTPVDPDEPDTPVTPGNKPTGEYSSVVNPPVITPEFKTVERQITVNGVPVFEEELDENGNQVPMMGTFNEFASADITFSWTDNFVTNTSGTEIVYLFQISNSKDFNSDRTEAILLLPSSMDAETARKVYDKVKANYKYIDENGVEQSYLKVFNDVSAWRTASGSSYTTSVTFDDSYLTVPVGMFVNSTNYWQIKAIDTNGNEAEYCNVQTFKPTYKTTKKEYYYDENDVLQSRDVPVTESIKDITPAKATNLNVKDERKQLNYQNTGEVFLEFDVASQGMGVNTIYVTINGTDVAGNKLPTDILTVNSAFYSSTVSGANTTHFEKELFDGYSLNGEIYSGQYLKDGRYTVTVTTENYNGTKTVSDSYSFIQDTTRPVIQSTATEGEEDNSTISVNFAKPENETIKDITVTLTWPIATDNFDTKTKSNVKGYYVWYKSSSVAQWQQVLTSNDNLVETNSCEITLAHGAKYDFKVAAVDNSNNRSTEVSVKDIDILYKDIDDSHGENIIPPFYTPLHITNEVVGEEGDPLDKIRVSTDNATSAAGRIVFTISNLMQIRGEGDAISVTLYEDNGNLKKLKTYNVKGSSDAKSSKGMTFDYLIKETGKQYIFEIKSADDSTVMRYDFEYMCAYFAKDALNDTAYQLKDEYVFDFEKLQQDIAPVSYDLSGQLRSFGFTLPTQPTEEGAAPATQFIGFGDATNYSRLHIDVDAKYSFNVKKNESDSNSTLKVTVLKAVSGSKSLKTVKSFSVAGNKLEATLKDLELTAGDYILKVDSTKAAKGASINYNIDATSQSDKYYKYINNTDDTFVSATDLKSFNDDAQKITAKTKELLGDVIDNFENTRLIFGELTTDAEGNETITCEFIGKSDTADFRKITVDESGEYTFSLLKNTYYNTETEKETPYGQNGTLTLNIYQINEGKTKLKKVKGISVTAKNMEKELKTYLASGEYYIEVKANSKKTALDYVVLMEKNMVELNGTAYSGEGAFSIDDNFVFEQTINHEVNKVYYFNDKTSSEQAKNDYEYVGYGEARNYYKVTFEKDGNYTFSVNTYDDREKNKDDSLAANYSNLKAVIYKANEKGNGMTAVKTVTLKSSKASASVELKDLAAGDYYIEVVATSAAKGKYALYNLSVTTNSVVDNSSAPTAEYSNFVEAKEYTVGTKADGKADYYEFNTGSVAGYYNFSFDASDTYKVYTLKDGKVKLSTLKLDKNNSAYLDADTTVYIGTAEKGSPDYGFTVKVDPLLTKNLDIYSSDNNADEASELTFNDKNIATEKSWVGYGDLESWSKINLDSAGSFNLTLDKTNQPVETALKVTVYKFTTKGASLKSVGSFTVKAGADQNMKNFLLESGEYYIQVKSTTAKGNAEFDLTINGSNADDSECFVARADNTDDTALTAKTLTAAGGKIENEWVGYSDEYDYFNIDVSESGYYDFSFKNTDASQVVLYVVNPANSKLTTVDTYKVKAGSGDNATDIFRCMLNSNSQYIAMVKSTNAKKGGNNTYTLTSEKAADKTSVRFTINDSNKGKYTFVDDSAAFDFSDFVIEKFNSKTGKLSTVKLNANDEIKLTAGDYFLTSANSEIAKLQVDIDDNAMTITIK